MLWALIIGPSEIVACEPRCGLRLTLTFERHISYHRFSHESTQRQQPMLSSPVGWIIAMLILHH